MRHLRSLLLAPVVVAVVACGDVVAPAPTASFNLPDFSNLTTWGATTAVENQLKVCGYALGGVTPANPGTAIVAVSGVTAAQGLIHSQVTVGHLECINVWSAPAGAADTDEFTITLTQVGPEGFQVAWIPSFYSNDGDLTGGVIQDNTGGCFNATANACTSTTVTVSRLRGATVLFKQNSPVPPPPAVCIGLTPGYWKNWRNHYTPAQFASLLPGTIAGSIAEADAIFAAKGPDPKLKLRWFVLANQLTLNLTGTTLPNPSWGNLTNACLLRPASPTLGLTLQTALNILNGVGGPYTNAYIDAVKTALDAFANMG
jgi:hypothetical protein